MCIPDGNGKIPIGFCEQWFGSQDLATLISAFIFIKKTHAPRQLDDLQQFRGGGGEAGEEGVDSQGQQWVVRPPSGLEAKTNVCECRH